MTLIDAFVLATGKLVLTLVVGTIFWAIIVGIQLGVLKLQGLSKLHLPKLWAWLMLLILVILTLIPGIIISSALGF